MIADRGKLIDAIEDAIRGPNNAQSWTFRRAAKRVAILVAKALEERDDPNVMRVCRWCLSPDLAEGDHAVLVQDGSDYESGRMLCTWPCGHEHYIADRQCGYCADSAGASF